MASTRTGRAAFVLALFVALQAAAVASGAEALPPARFPDEFPTAVEQKAIREADPGGAGPAAAIAALACGDAAGALPVLTGWNAGVLEDCRVYFLARAAFGAGDAAGAARALDGYRAKYPESPWTDAAAYLSALASWRLGDRKGAIGRATELARRNGSPLSPWALAQAALWRREAGDPGWREEVSRLGTVGLGHPAATALASSWNEPLAPLLSDEALLAAIRAANERRALGVLFPALDVAVTRFGDRISGEILDIDGTASYQMRKRDRASRAFEAILARFPASASLVPKALYHQALLAYREDDTPTAHAKIRRLLKEYPSSSWAQRGAKSIARDYFRHGDRAEARRLIGEILAKAESPIFDVVWTELWLAFRDGDEAVFRAKGDEAFARWKEHYRRGRIAYWKARLGAAGEQGAGAAAFGDVARDFPANLWGILAAWRAAGGTGDLVAPAAELIGPAIPPVTAPPVPTSGRARAFLALGLHSFAARVEPDPTARGWLLTQAGDYAGALSLAAKGSVPSAGWSWRFSYPRAYRDLVEREAAEAKIEPALVWAIMREESRYDPLAVSVSDARGLMQLYPPTTLPDFPQMATCADDFFDVATNIAIGVRILARGVRAYEGALVPAIAAYNAGGGAVNRWVSQGKGLPIDEFIEEISYDQTRDYVARVVAAYAAYKALERVDP